MLTRLAAWLLNSSGAEILFLFNIFLVIFQYSGFHVLECILILFLVIFLAGLRFEEIAGADVWHCDVRVFSVLDLGSCELLGYCFLDLFSRLSFLAICASSIIIFCQWKGKTDSCWLFLQGRKIWSYLCVGSPEQCIINQRGTAGFFSE